MNKQRIIGFSTIIIIMMALVISGCKKDDSASNPTQPNSNKSSDSTVYYVSYSLSDTAYNFTSKKPNGGFGIETSLCRIGYPNDYYSGIDIEFSTPSGTHLTYASIKALEGKYVPFNNNMQTYSTTVKVSTLTPKPFDSYTIDSVIQKGKFYVEKVTQLPSYSSSPANKVMEVKGTFYCNLSDGKVITNGTYLIKLVTWAEY